MTRTLKNAPITDATCPAIYAGLQAAEKVCLFYVNQRVARLDRYLQREELKVIITLKKDDLIVCIPPIVPDFTFFHVTLADSEGNVFIGSDSELKIASPCIEKTLVSADMIVEINFTMDPDYKNNTILIFI